MQGDKTLDGYQKKKYVCKLLFIFLLGHDIDFGQVTFCGYPEPDYFCQVLYFITDLYEILTFICGSLPLIGVILGLNN
jgi:hypothetical protein